MSDDRPSESDKRLGLTRAEWDNLKGGVQYIGAIVLTVVITFVIVATVARWFGY
jgi:hypothetical protein